MPIFSGNRVSAGSMSIVANENYGEHDFGRVLYECALNDSKVFNAALLREFKEVEAVREGTMMTSELRAFQEFSVKEAWANLKEKMKKLWEKIKGIFKKVTAKLAVWFVRNGKAYVAMNKGLLNRSDLGGCKIPNYRKKDKAKYEDVMNTVSYLDKIIEKGINVDGAATPEEIKAKFGNKNMQLDHNGYLDMLFTKMSFEVDKSNVTKSYMDYVFAEAKECKFSETGVSVSDLFGVISTGKDPIKKLKKAEKAADKSIKSSLKAIDKASKNDEDKDKSAYQYASKFCSAYQTAITADIKAQIAIVKFDIKQSRAVVAKLAAYSPKNENALFEMSCYLEAAEDFEDEMEDIDASDAEAEDVKIEIDINTDGDVDVNED